ncbi:MAG: hypothetical protein SGPRY_004643 [Prymnesium sp.]
METRDSRRAATRRASPTHHLDPADPRRVTNRNGRKPTRADLPVASRHSYRLVSQVCQVSSASDVLTQLSPRDALHSPGGGAPQRRELAPPPSPGGPRPRALRQALVVAGAGDRRGRAKGLELLTSKQRPRTSLYSLALEEAREYESAKKQTRPPLSTHALQHEEERLVCSCGICATCIAQAQAASVGCRACSRKLGEGSIGACVGLCEQVSSPEQGEPEENARREEPEKQDVEAMSTFLNGNLMEGLVIPASIMSRATLLKSDSEMQLPEARFRLLDDEGFECPPRKFDREVYSLCLDQTDDFSTRSMLQVNNHMYLHDDQP